MIVPSVAVVVLNWRTADDLIVCLESVSRSDYPSFRVIVCDNGSGDDVEEKVIAWTSRRYVGSARGAVFQRLDRAAAETWPIGVQPPAVSFIQTGENLGFAGGNNVGLRLVQRSKHFDYAWLLNPDTVVDPKALVELVRRAEESSDVGIVGSTLVYEDDRTTIQARGGATYSRWTGLCSHLGIGEKLGDLKRENDIEAEMDYVIGASMLVSMRFLNTIGLLREDYFLYYEELDWSYRSREQFRLAYASNSIVFHKEGRAIGSSHRVRPSDLSLRYLYRNRMLFAWRNDRLMFPLVWLSIAREILVWLRRRDPVAARIAALTLFGLYSKPH